MLYPFTTENYGTLSRTFGFGFCGAVGRLGSTVMPYIVLPLIDVDIKLIFIVFSFTALCGSVATFMVPREPMDRPLDE